jgi:hypothetical protein
MNTILKICTIFNTVFINILLSSQLGPVWTVKWIYMSIRLVVWGRHKSRDENKEIPGTDVTLKETKHHNVTITSKERNN